jgi:hypothetical protein
MPCDTKLKANQTISDRKEEVRQTVTGLEKLLRERRIRPIIGPQGAITFSGWTDGAKAGVTDACAYRRIMATGSALARAEIERAELLSGRKINKQQIAIGAHSHDGGTTWHSHKG